MLHDIERKKMIQMAADARVRAYAPYSGYAVGACLKGESGAYYLGCNVENGALSVCNCAERTAIFKAVSESERSFSAIAIVTEDEEITTPCGVCRQALAEFCADDISVVCATTKGKYHEYTLGELLPAAFVLRSGGKDKHG